MTDTLTSLMQTYLYKMVLLICISAAAMLTAMAIDLVMGVRKARQNGIATTSKGFKKTCEKGRKYFLPYLVLVLIDVMACTVLPAPLFSMIWAAYCVYCEFVSVREKAYTKKELDKQDRTMNVIIENKEDIAKLVLKLLQEQTAKTITPTDEDTKE